ncbi:MAG: RagB/SusD family nutrient uptake outer membrane protein [Bacteroidetes bacterium]|nr:MAG: RagB/SusD family nutrient uptake outer membrane protein [Bacteroidota bacterium]
MKRNYKIAILFMALAMVLGSCVKDLNTKPLNPLELTSEDVYKDANNYILVLAKLYAGLALSGQQGPAGNPDIAGIDEGFGEYLRGYWYHQELSTDEAVIGWNDQTIKDFHSQNWGSSDVFISAMYYRIYYQICLCNEFIRETTPEKLSERGITGPILTDIAHYRAEARFLRALSYYHALDLFGNVPFVTDADPVGKFFPQQIMRASLFDYLDAELNAIEPLLIDARQNEYGRADKAAVWALLAKLYLNAEVYKGSNRYTDCVNNCVKIINAGYSLDPEYQNLFLADNHNTPESIFTINFDGLRTQTWGGTTFIIHAAIGGSMVPADFGVGGGWGGTRTTKSLVQKFYPEIKNGLYHSPIPPKSAAAYTLLYCPGSYQGWDPTNTTTVLASALNDGNFEGYLYFPDANTEFKFCVNPNWDLNYGDDNGDGTLEQNGANIVAADAGYYKVNVDLNNLTYTKMNTTWGVIGSATAGGWDSDQNMDYDATGGVWVATLDLTVGEIKFRANDSWDLNYGDDGANGILEQNGANIAIPEAGTYVITMKLGIPDYTYSVVRNSYDKRAMFWTDGQSLDINDIGTFTDGYAIAKFKNVTSTGQPGSDQTFVDNDFILFRLADVYLMYAEAVLRGGGGSEAQALQYVNDVRTRAYGDELGNITQADLTLDFILDERARELYWEATRRTDLVRYGKFTGGDYIWQWKGGTQAGSSTSSIYNIFPLPASDVSANPNLKQNPGY